MTTVIAPRPTLPAPARHRPTRIPAVLRHSATLAWRGVVKTIHSTEALLDVTLQPVIFLLLFVYVFGGAIAGDTATYLQYALPGVLVQTVVFASAGTGTGLADDLKTGIFDRFRSLPISRTAPLLGAIGADLVRYVTSGAIMLAFGFLLGFRTNGGVLGVVAALGLVTVFAFALCWVFTALAMVVREPRSVQGLGAAGDAPADLRQQRVRPDGHAARLAAGVRRDQPGLQGRRRGPRPAHRGRGVGAGLGGVDRLCRAGRGFRPLAVALYRRRT
jgi:oleandomycin transport system permease protein